MQKFEIWTIAGGEHTSKPRPCMIAQANEIDAFDTVVIAPLTTFAFDNKYRLPISATPNTGLYDDSFIEIEKLSAVKKKFLGTKIGEVPSETFVGIDKSVADLLGIKT